MKRTLVPILAALAAVGLVYTLWGVFVVTPMDIELFFSQKIFYYHVPNWFVLFTAVVVAGISSLLYLKKRAPRYDDVATAAAELAVLFGAMGLITGSIWARAAWNAWWVWEPRLVTSLLIWLIMVGYVLVRRFGGTGAERLAAGLAVFGMVDIPLIYVGVNQGDRHPQAKVVKQLDEGTMKLFFWLSVLTYFLIFAALLLTRIQAIRAERELRVIHERGLDAGLLES